MMEHKWETESDGAKFCGACDWFADTDRGRGPCEGNRRERKTRELMAAVLLADNPAWPQPVDPFADLPSAERATCDRDHVS
jgi:hypothetical protein